MWPEVWWQAETQGRLGMASSILHVQKMTPEQLKLYTMSVFQARRKASGEGSNIDFHLPNALVSWQTLLQWKLRKIFPRYYNRSLPKILKLIIDIGMDNKQSPAHIASTNLVSEPKVWVQSVNILVSFLPPSLSSFLPSTSWPFLSPSFGCVSPLEALFQSFSV